MAAPLITLLSVLRLTQAPTSAIDDGVRALVRGDYQTATSVLRPLAERADADPAAQFLLGVLYMSGRMGRAGDLGRACGLLAAAASSTSVFAAPATELAADLRGQLGRGAMLVCVAGPTPEYIPASFTLGPGHTVVIGASGVTVRYQGTERKNDYPLAPGMVALPVRYTPLDVPGPPPVRRHFLLQFVWWTERPDAPSEWRIHWALNEVVGADYVPVTGDPSLLVAPGARPPDGFDVDRLIRVFVNANGDVEWQAGTADNLRHGIVPRRDPK